jgi:hypothetical protein
MPNTNRIIPKTLILAYISVFASLNVLADTIPFTPILGIPEASFRLGWILSPLTGILLGAEIGGISCIIAGLIELLYQPLTFGPFTPLRSAVSASIAGMLASNNWYVPAASLFSLIIIWILLPIGKEAYMILLFHVVGLAMILLFRGNIAKFIRSEDSKKTFLGLFFAAYSGNISRHLFGNILSATLLNMPVAFFLASIPFTFVEQLVFAFGAAIIGISLNRLHLRELIKKI